MAKKLKNYDPAEDLTSKKAIAIFLAEALQTNDAAYISDMRWEWPHAPKECRKFRPDRPVA